MKESTNSHEQAFTLQRTEYIDGYVVAPMAERLLAENPPLKTEFEARLAADRKFAADPAARLQWFMSAVRSEIPATCCTPLGSSAEMQAC